MFSGKSWMEKMERWMVGITFAEAGARETALRFLNDIPKKKRVVSRPRKHVAQRPTLRA